MVTRSTVCIDINNDNIDQHYYYYYYYYQYYYYYYYYYYQYYYYYRYQYYYYYYYYYYYRINDGIMIIAGISGVVFRLVSSTYNPVTTSVCTQINTQLT